MYGLFRAHPFIWFGILSFAFAAMTAIFIQFVLLPHVVPAWHAGHGLLVGGDWVGFHRIAAELSAKMGDVGWQAWQLRPQSHAPAGIAAIFYHLFTPEPWVLIPLNASLHALAAALLAKIIWNITGRMGISILATLPFLLYPSAAAWYSQIHKDSFFITGFLACLYGWLKLVQYGTWQVSWRPVGVSVAWIVGGTLLIGMVRDYAVQLIVVMGSVFAVVATIRLVRVGFPWPRWRLGLALTLLFSIPIVTTVFSTNHYKEGAMLTARDIAVEAERANAFEKWGWVKKWQWTKGLPRRVDSQFYAISVLRHGHITSYPDAKSNIDPDVQFHSAPEFVPYLPRALQIGLFSPFPSDWAGQGSMEANTFMRRISAAEMLGVYGGLFFVPYSLWRWRRRIETWLVAGSFLFFLVLYSYVFPNMGTLYRMRYVFLMGIVVLGVAGAVSLIGEVLKRRASKLTT